MKEITGYVTIRIRVECADHLDPEEVLDEIGSNCDYNVEYTSSGGDHVQVVDTELLSCEVVRHLGDR